MDSSSKEYWIAYRNQALCWLAMYPEIKHLLEKEIDKAERQLDAIATYGQH